MLWYIFVCSMIGGISVSVTTGLGAAIVQTAKGDNQVRVLYSAVQTKHPIAFLVQILVYILFNRIYCCYSL